MVKYADCRRCKYFIPYGDMTPEEMRRAAKWVEARRPGAPILGWCRYYQRPVTYYTGYCGGFSEEPEPPPGTIPLTSFLEG